jgi:hypothetical protein
MDGERFDRLIQSERSRRGVLTALLVGGLATGRARPAAAGAPACTPNGETCDSAWPDGCCSGSCKKHKGKFKCAPAGQAFGCPASKSTDVCKGGGPIACPDKPAGTCVVARTKRKNKPLCMLGGQCVECLTDADCVAKLSDLTARCLKRCSACGSSGGSTICVIPA